VPEDTVWLQELNEQQKQAVTAGDGPLLVVAGAGSGKTRTLAYRLSYLIQSGVSPEKILLLTFTRRAALEMVKRACSVLPGSTAVLKKVWGGTFHATANRLLRLYHKAAGLSPDFTIMDQGDSADMLNVIRDDLQLAKGKRRFPKKNTCLAIYSRKVNSTNTLKSVLTEQFPWCGDWQKELSLLFKEYVKRKQKQSILDYDDLLLYWFYLLQSQEVASAIEKRFDHILVDEYQDTNKIQAGILQGMRQNNKNILAVGDDAQSIYSFRAAEVQNMLDFPKQFPGTQIITLEQNYRSSQAILETSNRIIAQAKNRYSKNMWSEKHAGVMPILITCKDEEHECQEVISRIIEHNEQGIALREQAVLFRASNHSAALELELTRRKIPFKKYGGVRFLEAAHIKDLMCILRVLENPQDEIAWFRILLLLTGIGPATARSAYTFLQENTFSFSKLSRFSCPAAAHDEFALMCKLFNELHDKNLAPHSELERIADFYKPLVKNNYENAEVRIKDIEFLCELASGFKSRKKFLEELVLDPPNSTSDLAGSAPSEDDVLTLSTIHSAKGAEWDVVYVIHASDGCLPSDRSVGNEKEIEEELRLAYVAMTRPRDFLYVSWPLKTYSKPGGWSDLHSYGQCSRFLTEEVLQSMKRVSSIPPGQEEEQSVCNEDADIQNKLLDMWD